MPKIHIFVLFFNVGYFHFPENYACSCWLRNSYWRSLYPPWLFSLRLPINPFTESIAKMGVGATIPEKDLSLKGSRLTDNALWVPACERLIVLWQETQIPMSTWRKKPRLNYREINRQVLARQTHGNGRKAASLGKDWFCWARASLTAKV